MITALRINIFGVFETFEYAYHVFREHNMEIYCYDKGYGPFRPIDEWIAPDNSIYRAYGYRDGLYKNDFELTMDQAYSDILIIRFRKDTGLPISIDLNHIYNYYEIPPV